MNNYNKNMFKRIRAYIATMHRLLNYNDVTVVGINIIYLIEYDYSSYNIKWGVYE